MKLISRQIAYSFTVSLSLILAYGLFISCTDTDGSSRAAGSVARSLTLIDVEEEPGRWWMSEGHRQSFGAWYDSSLYSFQRAVAVYAEAEDWASWVDARAAEGGALERLSRFEEGLAVAEEAIDTAQVWLGASLAMARAMDVKGENLIRLGRYSDALGVLDSSLTIRRSLVDSTHADIGRSFYRIGWTNLEMGRLQTSISYLEKSQSIFLRHGQDYLYDLAKTLNVIGNVHNGKSDYVSAIDFLMSSLEIKQTLFDNDHPQVGYALGNLSNNYRRMGNLDLALNNYLQALAIFKIRPGYEFDTALALGNIGRIFRLKGDNATAKTYIEESLRLYESTVGTNHSHYATILGLLGEIHFEQNNFETARRMFAQSVSALEESNSHVSWRLRGMYCRTHGADSLEAGVQCVNSAIDQLDASVQIGDYDRALLLSTRARLFSDANQCELGVSSFANAVEILDAAYGTNSPVSFSTKVDFATCLISMGKFDTAASILRLNANSHTWTSDLDSQESSLRSKAFFNMLMLRAEANILRHKMGNDQSVVNRAFNDYLLAAKLGMSASRHARPRDPNNFVLPRSSFDALAGFANTDLRSESELASQFFTITELSRSRTIHQFIHLKNVVESLDISVPLRQQESDLSSRIRDLHHLILSSQIRSEADLYRRQLIRATQSYDSLIAVFEIEYPAYYQLKHKTETATIADVQNFLDASTALLEYVVGTDSTYAFIITSDSVSLSTIGPTDSVRAAVDVYRGGLSGRSDSLYFVGAFMAYDRLVRPIAETIGDKDLIIVPDDFLFAIPFEPLLDSDKNSTSPPFRYSKLRYFLHDRNISYAYSATLLLETREQPRVRPRKDLLAFAPVVSGGFLAGTRKMIQEAIDLPPEKVDSLKDLPASRQEVKRIRKVIHRNPLLRYLPIKSRVYIDRRAVERKIKSASAADYRYVHFATHGFVRDDHPDLSSLILRAGNDPDEDGILYLGEVYNLKLNADLVVLSACETGLGRITSSEGVIGMTRGFLYAGARNVVVSLWLANDVAARDTMVPFYRELRNGRSHAEAMRLAKLEFMTLSTLHAKPYYWAPFIVIGQ